MDRKDSYVASAEYPDDLVQKIERNVRAVALSVLKWYPDLADEVVDEVFLRLYSRAEQPDNPVAWCVRVAYRYAVRLCQERNNLANPNDWVGFVPPRVEREEVVRLIRRFFRVINDAIAEAADEDDAMLYRLHVLEQRPWKEVAQRLEWSEEKVRQRYSRLLRRVAKCAYRVMLSDGELSELFERVLDSQKHFRQAMVRMLHFVAKQGFAYFAD